MDLYIDENGVLQEKKEDELSLTTFDYNEFELLGVNSDNVDKVIDFLGNVIKILDSNRDSI